MRIALVHDWVCGLRGGELVLDQIAQLVEREHEVAALYVMFDDLQPLTPCVDRLPHAVSGVGKLPMASRLRRWLLPLYPLAVEQLSELIEREHRRRAIDLVISSSSAAVKGVKPPRGVPHLCYCHSPARYVWSRGEEYAGGLRGAGLAVWGSRFRAWDARTAANVTRFIANSAHTAAEVKRCYGRDAEVVHPSLRPVFEQEACEPEPQNERRGWLVVSALEPYKRVDLAIAAANKTGAELVVVGSGSQREKLQQLAGPTVRMLGRVSDPELLVWYRKSRLLLFPQVEDFGLVAVEAQACGLPVVARAAGGALETVVDGVTGSFFSEPTVESLLGATERCPSACGQACRDQARKFGAAQFDARVRDQINAVMNRC